MQMSATDPTARQLKADAARTSMPLLFASRDLDQTRTHVGQVMKPHRLTVAGSNQCLDARMEHVSIGSVCLSRLRYGADVDIVPGPLDDFYLVQMPLSGAARIRCGNAAIDSTPALASVLSPADATAMRWHAGNDQLMVRLTRTLVERTLAARLGRPLDRPLRFALGLATGATPAWTSLVRYLLDCVTQVPELTGHPLIVVHLEQLVAGTLLSVQPHDHADVRPTRCAVVLPHHVRRVEEFIRAHADEPLDISRLARVAGVSARSLHSGFSRFLDTTPMHYLRDVRLDRARVDLLQGGEPVGVVALRWGFAHAGRFSAEYRARFGENPAETRRRR